MSQALRTAVAHQRLQLAERLSGDLAELARACRDRWNDRDALEALLTKALPTLPSCKYLYLLDHMGQQITANIARSGLMPDQYGRDRSERPYLTDALAGAPFSMSPAYLSRNQRRPSLTAVQRIESAAGNWLGLLGADFDLRDLPLTRELYRQPDDWMQLKGDPAIRGGLFLQERAESLMDGRIDEVLPLFTELVLSHGVFHGKLHFSSSRATLWLLDDPYRYRVLDIEDLTDPGICLAYTTRDYHPDANIPAAAVGDIVAALRELRFMDETIYLRSGSLNIMNGLVALNFSCDGSHYMHWREFLDKKLDFWLGSGLAIPATGTESTPHTLAS